MKKMKKQKKLWKCLIAGLLSLWIGAAGPVQAVFAFFAADLDTYTAIQDGTYDPKVQGYYGFFPVEYYQGENLVKTGIPALVYNSHAYLDFQDICERLEIDSYIGTVYCVIAHKREISFQKDSDLVYIKIGPTYIEYKMPIPTVWQDERLWIPAEWFAWLTGMTFVPIPQGYFVMGAPEQTALDVVLELQEDTDVFDYLSDFRFAEKDIQNLDKNMKLFDAYDGIWSMEADKWKAVILGGLDEIFPVRHWWNGSDPDTEKMFDLLMEQGYAKEFIKMILEASPQEASSAFPVANDVRKMLFGEYAEYLQEISEESIQIAGNMQNQADIATLFENIAYQEGKFRYSQAWGRYFNKMMAQSAEMKNKAIRTRVFSKMTSLGIGVDVVGKLFDYGCVLQTYENRDEIALKGAKSLLEQSAMRDKIEPKKGYFSTKFQITEKPENEYISPKIRETMEKVVEDYEKGKTQFALSRLFAEKGEDYLGEALVDFLADMAGSVFSLFNYTSFFYKLETALNEKYSAMRNAAEAFEHSLIGLVYQEEAKNSLYASYGALFPDQEPWRLFDSLRQKDEEKKETQYGFFADAMEVVVPKAYQFLKARCVTRSLAISTLVENEKTLENTAQTLEQLPDFQKQKECLKKDETYLSILAQYCREDLPIPENWNKRSSDYQDEYLVAIITPAYAKVKGQCVDAESGQPVENVDILLQDKENNDMSQFTVKQDGKFELYVPLLWKEQNCTKIEDSAWHESGKSQAESKLFIPWEKEFYKYYAFPHMDVYSPIKVTASHKDYPDYEENNSDKKFVFMDGKTPVKELEWDLGKIELGQEPYYPYIRDHLLPQMGYASQETTSCYVNGRELGGNNSRWAWDDRKGILGADIADLNNDGIKDMLVYYFDLPDWEDWMNGFLKDPPALYVDLYTLTEERNVTLVDHIYLDVLFSHNFNMLRGGLMEVNGQTLLYVEDAANAYFANGGGINYYWYGYDAENGKLRPYWENGQTEGGSVDFEYSLIDRTGDGKEKKQVLYASDMRLREYQNQNNGKNPPASDFGTALELGFSRMGLPEPTRVELKNYDYPLYDGQINLAPTYWGTDHLKQSFEYICSGSGDYQGRNMTVTVKDFTELKEHIEKISK